MTVITVSVHDKRDDSYWVVHVGQALAASYGTPVSVGWTVPDDLPGPTFDRLKELRLTRQMTREEWNEMTQT